MLRVAIGVAKYLIMYYIIYKWMHKMVWQNRLIKHDKRRFKNYRLKRIRRYPPYLYLFLHLFIFVVIELTEFTNNPEQEINLVYLIIK